MQVYLTFFFYRKDNVSSKRHTTHVCTSIENFSQYAVRNLYNCTSSANQSNALHSKWLFCSLICLWQIYFTSYTLGAKWLRRQSMNPSLNSRKVCAPNKKNSVNKLTCPPYTDSFSFASIYILFCVLLLCT